MNVASFILLTSFNVQAMVFHMTKEEIIHIVIDSLPKSDPTWLEVIGILSIPLLTFVAVGIAILQYRINSQRLRFELYEKRLRVYKIVHKYLSEVMNDGTIDADKIATFGTEASEGTFLFDKDASDKITEIKKVSMSAYLKTEEINRIEKASIGNHDFGKEYEQLVKTQFNLVMWHSQQLSVIETLFAKYLKQ